jgi:putative membrane protein
VAARPYGTMMWALPRRLRLGIGWLLRQSKLRDMGKWLSSGGIATVVHAVAIWAWHVPVLFDASVLDVTLHRVQHLSFFVTGLLFWWSVLNAADFRLRPRIC